MTRLPTFTTISEITWIGVGGNPALVEGPSFPSLYSMGSGTLDIENNAALERIDGFSNLQEADMIAIRDNPQLQAVEFPGLQRASILHISCNAELSEASLSPLQSVSSSELMLEGNRVARQLPTVLSLAAAPSKFTSNIRNLYSPACSTEGSVLRREL